jgi:hypothetical protein
MKYIGILNQEEFRNLSDYEIIESLVDKNIFIETISLFQLQSIDELEKSNDIKTVILPNQHLVNQFWNYIQKKYKDEFVNIKNNYFISFEETCYGLNQEQKKNIALEDFNNIYNNLEIQLPYYIESIENLPNNVYETKVHTKLFKVYHLISYLKSEITGFKEVKEYLRDNLTYYDDDFLKNNIEFSNLLHLITVSEILVELNQRFNFEEDIYFNNEFTIKIKYENEHIKKVFKSIEGFSFANCLIESFDKDVKANIESLYEVLRSQNLIIDNKRKFIFFLQEEYFISISKIISYDFEQNYQHDKRVADFLSKWLNR